MSHPFQGDSVPDLYAHEERTRRRSGALLSAKTEGRNISEVVVDFARSAGLPSAPVIADIGCGQGRTAVRLAHSHPAGTVLAIDASPAMTAAVQQRAHGLNVKAITADFHALPLPSGTADLAVAIMCLYHSPTPDRVIKEMTRILKPAGTAILVTKAADSYRELADLLARSGLDPHARSRPSLYASAHNATLHDLAEAGGLTVHHVEDETHTFTFESLAHTADYLSTCPQYEIPASLRSPEALAEALRVHVPDGPVTTTATIGYLVGRPA